MPKINAEEYKVLQEAQEEGYKWIARDEDTILEKYKERPYKFIMGDVWKNEYNFYGETHEYLGKDLFQFIQWEDEEPHNIAELIEEYENTIVITEFVDGKWRNRIKESEETEVKNIEWLKDEILTDMRYLEGNREIQQLDIKYQTLREVAQKINSLDEPETLSQDWIVDNVSFIQGGRGYVLGSRLQNLLVPKQEITEEQVMNWIDNNEFYDHVTAETVLEKAVDRGELGYYGTKYSVAEKPTIPQFVADWVEECKGWDDYEQEYDGDNAIDLFSAMDLDNAGMQDNVHDYLVDNTETFARAWLDGYEVAEEQKYVIKLDDESYLQRYEIDNKNIVTPFRIVGHLKEVAIKFDNKERAEKVAELVEGKVEELEE